jgi:hypothetical protein
VTKLGVLSWFSCSVISEPELDRPLFSVQAFVRFSAPQQLGLAGSLLIEQEVRVVPRMGDCKRRRS